MNWTKQKDTTGIVEPSKKFLEEQKRTFQRKISTVMLDHGIPSELVFNLDQTPFSYVSPGKYTFSSKGSKNVPIKDLDDKRQITATFVVTATGSFLPIQLIYQGESKRCLRSISPYSVRMQENTDQNNCEYGHFLRSVIHINYLETAALLLLSLNTCVLRGRDNTHQRRSADLRHPLSL